MTVSWDRADRGVYPSKFWTTKSDLRRKVAEAEEAAKRVTRYADGQRHLVDDFMAANEQLRAELTEAHADRVRLNAKVNDLQTRLERLAEDGDEVGKHWSRAIKEANMEVGLLNAQLAATVRTLKEREDELAAMTAERDAAVSHGNPWACRSSAECAKRASDATHWRHHAAETLRPSHVPTSIPIVDKTGNDIGEVA